MWCHVKPSGIYVNKKTYTLAFTSLLIFNHWHVHQLHRLDWIIYYIFKPFTKNLKKSLRLFSDMSARRVDCLLKMFNSQCSIVLSRCRKANLISKHIKSETSCSRYQQQNNFKKQHQLHQHIVAEADWTLPLAAVWVQTGHVLSSSVHLLCHL